MRRIEELRIENKLKKFITYTTDSKGKLTTNLYDFNRTVYNTIQKSLNNREYGDSEIVVEYKYDLRSISEEGKDALLEYIKKLVLGSQFDEIIQGISYINDKLFIIEYKI